MGAELSKFGVEMAVRSFIDAGLCEQRERSDEQVKRVRNDRIAVICRLENVVDHHVIADNAIDVGFWNSESLIYINCFLRDVMVVCILPRSVDVEAEGDAVAHCHTVVGFDAERDEQPTFSFVNEAAR